MKILLINPPYFDTTYRNAKMKAGISHAAVPLNLCCVAAPLLEAGHEVDICDLNVGDYWVDEPDIIGLTSTTPTIHEVYGIIKSIKNRSPHINIVIGGAHATAKLIEVAKHADYVCEGEGDYFINDWVINKELRDKIINLDELPYPAYHLLDIPKYTSQIARKNPVAFMETSRGCYGRCTYCYQGIHGNRIRFKSVDRVFAEMKYILSLGFREIHIMDDNFSADKERVKNICQKIIESGMKFPWVPRNGIRVDRVDLEMLELMKKAGCYKVFFGVESGSQRILNEIKKNVLLDQIENAVMLAKRVRLGTGSYFMMGLPTETEEDLQKTIDFAVALNTNSTTLSFAVPLPGTAMFDKIKADGRLKSEDWSKYNFTDALGKVYEHDRLPRATFDKYSRKFHRKFYFRPRYILRKLFSRDVFKTIKMFVRIKW